MNKGAIWDSIEQEGYLTYDEFVNFLKGIIAPADKEKAYEVEDKINELMLDMFDVLEETF